MRINDKPFKDYYDLVYLGTQDNSIYYNRVPDTFSLENSELNEYYNTAASDIDRLEKKLKLYCYDLELAVLGFCGTLYPLYFWYTSERALYHTYRYVRPVLSLTEYAELKLGNKKENRKIKESLASITETQPTAHLKHFVDTASPVFIYVPPRKSLSLFRSPWQYCQELIETKNLSNVTTLTNPCLDRLGFKKIVEPWQAYQELEMFLGNTLVEREVMPLQSDVAKRDAHGFDDKSFKQVSPGKKANRRTNSKPTS